MEKWIFKVVFWTALIGLTFIWTACQSEEKEVPPTKEVAEVLIERHEGQFKEYYPGRKQVKIEGVEDAEGQRHGRWVFYSENGVELSVTLYDHGKKHGHSVVKYPNGALYYYGEYDQDRKIGIWKTYDQEGKLVEEKDFGK
ncbi:MAG: hypothetical protein EP338_04075 [Bacteroidetes bacterium]|nr:MAG: hypothetical protein EP338_04075 [Bacteroidota bacterium]